MRIITHCKNIFLKLVKAWVVVSLIMIPLLSLTLLYPDSMPHLDHIVSQHVLICTAFRWGILVAIYYTWPFFLKKIVKWKYWPCEQIKYWTTLEYWGKQRTKITLWLIIFELIVNEKLLLVIWSFWK